MKYQVEKITCELNDEDGISYVHFETVEGYLTISRSSEDTDVYFELDDQSYGEYFLKDCFEVVFFNGKVTFSINLNNKRVVSYLQGNNKNYEKYKLIELEFEPLSKEQFLSIVNTYREIFRIKPVG